MLYNKRSLHKIFDPNLRNTDTLRIHFMDINSTQDASNDTVRKINTLIKEIEEELK